MKKFSYLIILIILATLFSCDKEEDTLTNNLGTLHGTVGIFTGNCMPGVGVPPCEAAPISTDIAITLPSEEFDNSLIVRITTSTANGTFSAKLPAGNYSLFLKDGSEFVCTIWSCPNDCFCLPFEIKENTTTEIVANIDHAVW